jgi:hypothetical protein
MSTGPTGPKGTTGATGPAPPVSATLYGTIAYRKTLVAAKLTPGTLFYATDVLQLQMWNGAHWVEVMQGPIV